MSENTLVIYTSDQGFFLGEHGWFDKRFMYESLQMPFSGAVSGRSRGEYNMPEIACNVDFAPLS